MASLPPIGDVGSLGTEQRAEILDLLFEPCTQLHTLSVSALQENIFSTYADLINYVCEQLKLLFRSNLESDIKWLDAILSAHPRLGQKKVESEESRKEQAQLNRDGGGGEETQKLSMLNQHYEETFPGLKYVVFVNGRGRGVIMEDMQRRIDRGDIQLEKQDAIKAMGDIALDRSRKLARQ